MTTTKYFDEAITAIVDEQERLRELQQPRIVPLADLQRDFQSLTLEQFAAKYDLGEVPVRVYLEAK